jgi:hypothetical protein
MTPPFSQVYYFSGYRSCAGSDLLYFRAGSLKNSAAVSTKMSLESEEAWGFAPGRVQVRPIPDYQKNIFSVQLITIRRLELKL